jgi:hypothetical protein
MLSSNVCSLQQFIKNPLSDQMLKNEGSIWNWKKGLWKKNSQRRGSNFLPKRQDKINL